MTKLGEGSQEALVKTFVRKILTKMAKTGSVRIEDSKLPLFASPNLFFAVKMTFKVEIPLF